MKERLVYSEMIKTFTLRSCKSRSGALEKGFVRKCQRDKMRVENLKFTFLSCVKNFLCQE